MSSQSNCLLPSAQNRTIPTDPSQRRLWFSRHVDYTLAHKPLHTFEGRVILLNGFPGVGKFSIGRRLFNMLDHRHARFIDNHLLIDPVEAITPGRGTDHKALRRAFRKVAFDALCDITDRNLTLILTSCLSSTEEDQQVMEEYLAIASRRKVPFYLFNITCDRSEHHRRLLTTERSTGSKTKLIDPEILDDMLEKHKLVEIAEEGRDRPRRSGRYMFKHDTTTHCSIDESALMLYLHVKTGTPGSMYLQPWRTSLSRALKFADRLFCYPEQAPSDPSAGLEMFPHPARLRDIVPLKSIEFQVLCDFDARGAVEGSHEPIFVFKEEKTNIRALLWLFKILKCQDSANRHRLNIVLKWKDIRFTRPQALVLECHGGLGNSYAHTEDLEHPTKVTIPDDLGIKERYMQVTEEGLDLWTGYLIESEARNSLSDAQKAEVPKSKYWAPMPNDATKTFKIGMSPPPLYQQRNTTLQYFRKQLVTSNLFPVVRHCLPFAESCDRPPYSMSTD